jgi:hypothetical protein
MVYVIDYFLPLLVVPMKDVNFAHNWCTFYWRFQMMFRDWIRWMLDIDLRRNNWWSEVMTVTSSYSRWVFEGNRWRVSRVVSLINGTSILNWLSMCKCYFVFFFFASVIVLSSRVSSFCRVVFHLWVVHVLLFDGVLVTCFFNYACDYYL